MGYEIYIQILRGAVGEGLHHDIRITQKFTHYKTLQTLKFDIFKILDNKNIGKSLSKYGLVFLDQANSTSNRS